MHEPEEGREALEVGPMGAGSSADFRMHELAGGASSSLSPSSFLLNVRGQQSKSIPVSPQNFSLVQPHSGSDAAVEKHADRQGASKVQHPLDGFTKANEWRAGTVHQMEENMVSPKVSSYIRHLENMRENVSQKRAALKKSSNGYYSAEVAPRASTEKLNRREGSGGGTPAENYMRHMNTQQASAHAEAQRIVNDIIAEKTATIASLKLALDADEVKLLEMRSEVAELKSERSNTEARVRKYMIEREILVRNLRAALDTEQGKARALSSEVQQNGNLRVENRQLQAHVRKLEREVEELKQSQQSRTASSMDLGSSLQSVEKEQMKTMISNVSNDKAEESWRALRQIQVELDLERKRTKNLEAQTEEANSIIRQLRVAVEALENRNEELVKALGKASDLDASKARAPSANSTTEKREWMRIVAVHQERISKLEGDAEKQRQYVQEMELEQLRLLEAAERDAKVMEELRGRLD